MIGEYRIVTDPHNWTLQEKRMPDPNNKLTKSLKPKFVNIGHYGNVESLSKALLNHELKQSDINTLEDIQTSLHRIENSLKNGIEKVVMKHES